MVDISAKAATLRTARATARILMGKKAFEALMSGGSPKGDVFETARIAGIMAAKATPAIIPLCHSLELSKVKIGFETSPKDHSVAVASDVVCNGRTGVEMEALTAASVAVLTIYDMMKWADHDMVISEVKLTHKSGGKSGTFDRRT